MNDSPIPLTESPPPGLTNDEFNDLKPFITEFHNYRVNPGQCSSLLGQRVQARADSVWSILRRFDKPQTYKHFIKSCNVREGFSMTVGDLRDVSVISGLPAATSTERLDMMDEGRRVTGFSIIGGDHRLRNYKSVTSVHEVAREGREWTVVLESYVVEVPEGGRHAVVCGYGSEIEFAKAGGSCGSRAGKLVGELFCYFYTWLTLFGK